MSSKSFVVLSVVMSVCFSSCLNGNMKACTVEQGTAALESASCCRDTTVFVTETDSLTFYKPVFNGGIGLSLKPDKADDRVFIAAAAYTKSYTWSKFDHNLIAGPHIDGEFYEGYAEDANSGAFYYIHSSKKWDFVYNGYGEALRSVAESDKTAVGFSQVMLIYNGSVCSIHSRANPTKLRHRRAICEINDELYIVDSKHEVTMFEFAKCLKAAGVLNGLYMDMGSMKYSLYKEYSDGDWTEIHSRNYKTKYCTNYLVFYL